MKPHRPHFDALVLLLVTASLAVAQTESKAVPRLRTRFAKDVSSTAPHPEYPRPTLVREKWMSLNGPWDYAIVGGEAEPGFQAEGKILVPFPVESSLSGVTRPLSPSETLAYRRTFDWPGSWKGMAAGLHFGAVDYVCRVFLNGRELGTHRGGYDGFDFRIPQNELKETGNVLVVLVRDPTDSGPQPRGKQVLKPGGIFYTATSGIWQSVWIEPLPLPSIDDVLVTTATDRRSVEIRVEGHGLDDSMPIDAVISLGGEEVARTKLWPFAKNVIEIKNPRLWSPATPDLYDIELTLQHDDQVVDRVRSYFGMRTIEVAKAADGMTRVLLNGDFTFLLAPLDQGFWPEGLYTAPTDEALRYDLEVTRRLGFNAVRKHVKVEPERWYRWCDELGLVVLQDMPSGDRSIGPNDPDIERSEESASIFEQELRALINGRRRHPSIVMWIVYNEGWGQWRTEAMAALTKSLDPTRLVDAASGWTDRKCGDVFDWHVYPGPGSPEPEERRAAMLGEFGGLGMPVDGHTWQQKDNWGYVSYKTKEALTAAYTKLYERLRWLVGSGLSIAVYTQTTDVEIEVNGLMTYDRLEKMEASSVQAAHRLATLPAPRLEEVMKSSRLSSVPWLYTTVKPRDDWMSRDFDDGYWFHGRGGFGTKETPGAVVATKWESNDIWMRRPWALKNETERPSWLILHHDEDCEIYVNGILIHQSTGWTTAYEPVPIAEDKRAAFRMGVNTIAVHCRQTSGGQFIDVGFAIER